MDVCVGIDLGSTTTKAILMARDGAVVGRGITNSRSNYKVACEVAVSEAFVDARFGRVARALEGTGVGEADQLLLMARLTAAFRAEQYLSDLNALRSAIVRRTGPAAGPEVVRTALDVIEAMRVEARGLFQPGAARRSDFFRDLAGARYMAIAQERTAQRGVAYDRVVSAFDKAILDVENVAASDATFRALIERALDELDGAPRALVRAVAEAAELPIRIAASVGTGYGRATLPFPREQIRSEILCHGLGAHRMFPMTRTVLDIGGQDTKAIQVDAAGIVTSFQMNDRCAAGCGRYLGYIADEMNLGVHELGPIACCSTKPVRINSTCTVFAGAELRERLGFGEAREDILAGLHRAIMLRAMSLLARSGGVTDQLTFTGGVARNPAAVKALTRLVADNYRAVTINISPDSIYTGALGAALFAWRAAGAGRVVEVAA